MFSFFDPKSLIIGDFKLSSRLRKHAGRRGGREKNFYTAALPLPFGAERERVGGGIRICKVFLLLPSPILYGGEGREEAPGKDWKLFVLRVGGGTVYSPLFFRFGRCVLFA